MEPKKGVLIDVRDFVQVKLPKEDNFLKVKETLTRIGIASTQQKKLYQSCHILHKRGNYYIVHFKELFGLDGKPTNFSEEDRARRNTIANLLSQWGLVELVDPDKSVEPVVPLSKIKVIQFKDKANWKLESKYTIGKKRRPHYEEGETYEDQDEDS